tara:strand:+ start:1765 stop:2010 length:246 start_codon:yes stop_codon:yes gene_type:complete
MFSGNWQPGHYGLIPLDENTAREVCVIRIRDGVLTARTLDNNEEITVSDIEEFTRVARDLDKLIDDDRVELTENTFYNNNH